MPVRRGDWNGLSRSVISDPINITWEVQVAVRVRPGHLHGQEFGSLAKSKKIVSNQ